MPHSKETITATNADMLDGKHAEEFADAEHTHGGSSYTPKFFSDVYEWPINTVGNQVITCGFRPLFIRAHSGLENAEVRAECFGTWDAATNSARVTTVLGDMLNKGWITNLGHLVFLYFPYNNACVNNADVIDVTDTGFTLKWDKVQPLGVGTKIMLLIEVHG